MSSMILSPADIKISKLEFMPLKTLDNGGKSVNLRYDGRNLMVEAPSLSIPYGVNVFDKAGPPKYSVDFSLRGADENETIRALQDFMEAFDERMIDAGVENASKWFKMANPNREVIKAFYTPLVKISRDSAGNPKPYPPTFKASLRKKKDGAFETEFYDGTKKPLAAFASETPIEQILPKRAQATVIIQCTGVWFAGGKYGTTWKAVQLRVDTQPEQIRGPAFKSDAPDISAFLTAMKTSSSATAVPISTAAAGGGGYDVEEDEESELLAAVAPPAKKPAAPAPAPAAPAAFDEEENVTDAVPVPAAKKVVKKIVKKTA